MDDSSSQQAQDTVQRFLELLGQKKLDEARSFVASPDVLVQVEMFLQRRSLAQLRSIPVGGDLACFDRPGINLVMLEANSVQIDGTAERMILTIKVSRSGDSWVIVSFDAAPLKPRGYVPQTELNMHIVSQALSVPEVLPALPGEKTAQGYYQWGMRYRKQGDIGIACGLFSKAIAIDPEHTLPYKERGYLREVFLIDGGRLAAIEDYERFLALTSDDSPDKDFVRLRLKKLKG